MSAGAWLRAHRRSTAVVGSVLLVLVVLSIITVTSATRGGDLDPDNPGADGARAVGAGARRSTACR